VKDYKGGNTRNLTHHAEQSHGVVFAAEGGLELPKYPAERQRELQRVLVQGIVAHGLLPLRFFEGEGVQEAFRALAPRLELPSHQTVARILDGLDAEATTAGKELVGAARMGFPSFVVEVDCWPAPTNDNYIGIILHGIGPSFQPFSFLLYAGTIAEETAAAQGQRVIFACNDVLGQGVDAVAWAVQTDNAAKAYNIPALLGKQSLRCVCHLLALGPRHLLHPVRRVVQGSSRLQAHESAQPECFALLERARVLCKAFYNTEKLRGQLLSLARRLEIAHRAIDLDNPNKWKSTPAMLAGLIRSEALLSAFFVEHGHSLPDDAILQAPDFHLARELYGILLPVQNTSLLLEGDAFAGSSVLPLMALLAAALGEASPVQVPERGQVAQLRDVGEASLTRPAREFRAAMRADLSHNERHLRDSRRALLLASSLDPRWKGLAFASAEEREGTRAALTQEALQVLQSRGGQAPPRKLQRLRRQQDSALKEPGMERLLEGLSALQAPEDGGAAGAREAPAARLARDAVADWLASPLMPPDSSPLEFWGKAAGPDACTSSYASILAPLARKYLCAPGASGTIERLWSEGRRVLAFNRHALSEERVGQLLRLKFNMSRVGAWPPKAAIPSDP
jgi:hypothetical protein